MLPHIRTHTALAFTIHHSHANARAHIRAHTCTCVDFTADDRAQIVPDVAMDAFDAFEGALLGLQQMGDAFLAAVPVSVLASHVQQLAAAVAELRRLRCASGASAADALQSEFIGRILSRWQRDVDCIHATLGRAQAAAAGPAGCLTSAAPTSQDPARSLSADDAHVGASQLADLPDGGFAAA